MSEKEKANSPSSDEGTSRRIAPADRGAMAEALADFLTSAGLELPEELAETPHKAAEAWADSFLDGYDQKPAELFSEKYAARSDQGSESVTVRNIQFHGICPHHLLPFRGVANVSYIPEGNLASLSSLVRLVDCFAHRLEIQETVTRQIAQALFEHLPARGVAVALSTDQACMTMRGVRRLGAKTLTECYFGSFDEDADLKAQFQRNLDSE